jgi:DNA repair protein RadC
MGEAVFLTIKEWAEDDRPREKLFSKGKLAMTDTELLAILLNSGTRNESAVQLAQRIFSYHGCSLNELGRLTADELMRFKGIGKAKALRIVAALELGRRKKEAEAEQHTFVRTSADAYTHIAPRLLDLPHEEFWVMLLNRANKITRTELVSRGGVSGTVADIRFILKSAVEQLASSIIVAHNHPSGNLHPSDSDILLTNKIKEAAALFDIQLVDHIIVGHTMYYSFADEGLL